MSKGSGGTRTKGPKVNSKEVKTADQIFQDELSFFNQMIPSRGSFGRIAHANIGEIKVADAFTKSRKANAIREGALDAIGRMYDFYDIPKLAQIAFYGENRFSNEAAATSPDGKYMRFNTAIRSGAEAKEFAFHEMTHLMTGTKFERLSGTTKLGVQSIYNEAMKNISPARGRGSDYANYWRTNAQEFVSVSFQKALTGASMNEYEKRVFLMVHNQFKRK